jgi:hypothetical protein
MMRSTAYGWELNMTLVLLAPMLTTQRYVPWFRFRNDLLTSLIPLKVLCLTGQLFMIIYISIKSKNERNIKEASCHQKQ